jgi:hypothetical protein
MPRKNKKQMGPWWSPVGRGFCRECNEIREECYQTAGGWKVCEKHFRKPEAEDAAPLHWFDIADKKGLTTP